MALQCLKGMRDVLPFESHEWQYLESLIRELCKKHGFCETRTPVLEQTELFLRGVGNTTDIVQKEMYTFTDKGDRSVTLKPEGTAGVARMFVEHKLFNETMPVKMYYLNSPVFRYERPQAGRLREHHQFGVEMFGGAGAGCDAECIALACELFKRVGVTNLTAYINSIGCPNCRGEYNRRLKEYLSGRLGELCETCNTRFETNPLRILDCKEKKCREICEDAPVILDCLCDECKAHFEDLKRRLDALDIKYEVNPHIVRGLDYYTKTVFEIVSNDIGAQGTVCGGGRYDGLIEEIGGPKLPAVGFGLGMERLLLVAKGVGVKFPEVDKPDVYIAAMGDAAELAGFKLCYELRDAGLKAEFDHIGRSFKAQFKYADKIGARYVVVIGEDELASGKFKVKNMATGEEALLSRSDIAKALSA